MPRVRHSPPASQPATEASRPAPGVSVPAPLPSTGWVRTGTPATSTTDGFSAGNARPAARQPSVELAPGQQIFLAASGQLVPQAGQPGPSSALEQAETISRAAFLSEDLGVNLFSSPALSLPQKAAAHTALLEAFAGAISPGAGINSQQALQTRSSITPLLLDLAKSLDGQNPPEGALQNQIVQSYLRLVDAEPHGLARDFMIFDLDRAKAALPAAFRPRIDELMREVAPLTPPYEEWFANGNKTLKVDYFVGEGFWEEELAEYESAGFRRTNNPDGTVGLTKDLVVERPLNDGTVQRFETRVELTMHDGPSGMFDQMNDPSVQIVTYSGHANYGRQVPSHLPSAPGQNGAKLFVGLQCGGKGVHNALRARYPEMQVVSTKNSSYGYQDRKTFLTTLEGISQRLPWSQISVRNRSDNSDNYYFPSDTLLAKRAEDRDGDGKVDSWDRVVSFDTFNPQAHVSKQLTAKDPKVPADKLDGRALHGAVLRFHRMAGYSQWAEDYQDQKVLNAGFYEGTKKDPLLKLTPVAGEDGEGLYRLQINKFYAHATEETLGAALHYELGRHFAQKAGLPASDAKAAGLLMAAKALDVDTGELDSETWKALLEYAQLPSKISLQSAKDANHESSAYPAGSASTLASFKQALARDHISLR